MGREIRMVPPNWDHPKRGQGSKDPADYKPMLDKRFEDDAREWKENFAKWESGLRPNSFNADWVPAAEWEHASIYADQPNLEWWEYESSPPTDRDTYRPYTDAEATWVQVYETVSEGTPVTPPFATRAELVDYLVANGDFWDQARRREGRAHGMNCDPWKREDAEAFVNSGWAPSMVVVRSEAGVEILGPKDAAKVLG